MGKTPRCDIPLFITAYIKIPFQSPAATVIFNLVFDHPLKIKITV